MKLNNFKPPVGDAPFTLKQELANTIVHGCGLVLGFIAVPFLISIAIKSNEAYSIIGSCIYGACFLMVFTFSTLYHACRHQRRKYFLEVLDYISIYFLIAGTYTPFILHFMYGMSGFILLALVWSCS